MLFRSFQRRRQADRREAQQQHLLSEIRDAITQARFGAAFDLAERLLDHPPTAASYEALLCPVERSANGFDNPRLYDLLRRLESEPSVEHRPWRLLLRCSLLERLEWQEESFAVAAEFKHLPERYGWMRYNRGTMLMNRLWAYDEARQEIEATRHAAPDFWQAAGTLAECALCQGREAEAFPIMDDCIAHLSRSGRADDAEIATAWRGELRLWVGQYAAALADLDAAAAAERPFALGWHGAANLLLGHPDRALASLDKAVAVASSDVEVFVWRGEVHERLGQWDRARADFDRAVRLTGMPVWPLVGRALVKAQCGDGEGAIADFLALPRRIAAFFQWQTGTRVERDPERAVRVLRHMREAARGLRRTERYLDPLWMRRASPARSSSG